MFELKQRFFEILLERERGEKNIFKKIFFSQPPTMMMDMTDVSLIWKYKYHQIDLKLDAKTF